MCQEIIYDSYSAYANLKADRDTQDSVDIAMRIMKASSKVTFDEVYIDEAQVCSAAYAEHHVSYAESWQRLNVDSCRALQWE